MLETNETPETVPNLLPRFHHPEHGELEIYGFDGRSKLCRRVTDGVEFRIGSRVVNRLMGRIGPDPDAEIVTNAIRAVNYGMAEKLPEVVKNMLEALPDNAERVRIAREIWEAADKFCPSVGGTPC